MNEQMIKQIRKILKTNTTDSDLDWFNIGEYKNCLTSLAKKKPIHQKKLPTK